MVFIDRFFISTFPSFTTSFPFIFVKAILSNNTSFRLASIWKSILRGTSIRLAASSGETACAVWVVVSVEAVIKSFRLRWFDRTFNVPFNVVPFRA